MSPHLSLLVTLRSSLWSSEIGSISAPVAKHAYKILHEKAEKVLKTKRFAPKFGKGGDGRHVRSLYSHGK